MSSEPIREGAAACVCGEINMRHCPVHGQGNGLRSYDVTDLVSFDVQPNGSVLPNPLPTCAVCGAIISSGYHDCVQPFSRTSVAPLGGIHLTPWGTWGWRLW